MCHLPVDATPGEDPGGLLPGQQSTGVLVPPPVHLSWLLLPTAQGKEPLGEDLDQRPAGGKPASTQTDAGPNTEVARAAACAITAGR